MRFLPFFLFQLPLLLLALIACQCAYAKSIDGRVVRVSDGDTITVLTAGNKQEKIRLYGIDAPEKRQAFGEKSRQALASFVAGKTVKVDVLDVDRYGRNVGVVLDGNFNINRAMITQGMAWVYSYFCKKSFCNEWKNLEVQAQKSKKGLWRDPAPVPPWEWRKFKRSK